MSEPDFVIPAHEKYGLPLDFTPDGKTLITGGFDGTVSGWSVGDWSETVALDAHEQSVNAGAVTATDALVTGSTDATVRVWNLSRTENVGVLEGHKKTVAGLSVHPTREVVASASYDATVRVWNLGVVEESMVFEGHPGNVTSVEFVGDGATLASGGLGDELFIWSLDDANSIARLGGHDAAVAGLAVDGDDSLWTVGYGGTVYQWSTTDWTEVSSFELPAETVPSGIAVHPTAERIAVSKDGGTLLFGADGALLDEHETSIKGNSSPCWSPDGSWLAVGGADGKVRIYA